MIGSPDLKWLAWLGVWGGGGLGAGCMVGGRGERGVSFICCPKLEK